MRTTLTFLCCFILVVFQTYAQLENSDLEECVNVYQNTNWLQFQGDCETLAEAGDDAVNIGSNSFTLNADYPPSAGSWSVVSGTGGSFSNPNDPKATFTGDPDMEHTIQWEFFNECGRTAESITVGLFASNASYASFISEAPFLVFVGWNMSVWNSNQVTTDETVVPTRGGDWFDGGNWQRLHQHQYLPTDDRGVTNPWNEAYNGINEANKAIDLISPLSGFSGKNQVLAELRFVRALWHYWLMDLYGSIVLVTSSTPPANPVQSTRTNTYNFLENELIAILGDLTMETTHQLSDTYYGRGNKWAAQALLAKLYLNSGIYLMGSGNPPAPAELALAQGALDDIINNGPYTLAGNYFDNFTLANDNNAVLENIFTLRSGSIGGGVNTLQLMTLHTFQTIGVSQPWNGHTTLKDFYNAFDAMDVRLGDTTDKKPHQGFHIGGPQEDDLGSVVADGSVEPADPDGPNIFYTPTINEFEPNALRQAGIRVLKFEPDLTFPGGSESDIPILRFSDVILMKAEVEERLSPGSPMAVILVNQVQFRAGIALLPSLILDDIYNERGFELYWEGWRRQDMVRFFKYDDAWEFKGVSAADKEIMPIPQTALDANPNLTQNPGY